VLFAFFVYYVIENLLKLWSFKWTRWTMSYQNIANGIISLALITLHIIHVSIYGRPYVTQKEREQTTVITIWGLSRVVNMLLIFRLVNLAPSIQIMNAILSTSIDIMRSLRPVFGIMIVNYYVFALIGMQLFKNKINIDSFGSYNQSDPDSYCGSFGQLNYWANNFDDFFFVFNSSLGLDGC